MKNSVARMRHLVPQLVLVGVLFLLLLQSTWFWQLLFPLHHREIIDHYGREYGVDPYLVAAVIRVESKFLPSALSPKGAIGLMQIMPDTGEWVAEQLGLNHFTRQDLYDTEVNIQIGTWYLANLQDEFAEQILVLAAYNGGRGNVRRWVELQQEKGETLTIDQFPFSETRAYVTRVLRSYQRYREIYQKEGL